MLWDPRPEDAVPGAAAGDDGEWARRTAEEQLSAAGAAVPAVDRAEGLTQAQRRAKAFGVVFNPLDYPWTEDEHNVRCQEKSRLDDLVDRWYDKVDVGDGADVVRASELDDWQRFAYDIVLDENRPKNKPLRLMLLGSAGTGKSRTVRSFVFSKRRRVRQGFDLELEQKRLADDRERESTGGDAKAAAELDAREKFVRERVKNACQLAAPTGCASFQMKFGASTLHRVFGIPVGYLGPWQGRHQNKRYQATRVRLNQGKVFVIDEVSMLGRGFLGKIQFRIEDTMDGAKELAKSDVFLAAAISFCLVVLSKHLLYAICL